MSSGRLLGSTGKWREREREIKSTLKIINFTNLTLKHCMVAEEVEVR